MPSSPPTSAFARVAQLAADRRVHLAFQWLHLHERQIMRWQTELVQVAAPPFGERSRAEWLCERFRELGLDGIRIDEEGNAFGVFCGTNGGNGADAHPCLLLSAHIDTVFPAETPIEPVLDQTRLTAPGACDNGAGITAMLAIAKALRHSGTELGCDLVFAGNVGEEGEGDLRGMRFLYQHDSWRDRIAAHIVLDGAGHEIAVTHALGSKRFLATVTGPGGHSWMDAGRPNPIVVLSQAIARLGRLGLSEAPRTTFNVGTIEGGTAVNAIPEQASARFDLRSTDPEQLLYLEVELHRAIEDSVLAARTGPFHKVGAGSSGDGGSAAKHNELLFSIRKIGDRPAGRLATDSPLMETLRAVDRHLGIRTEPRVASTDANIPLSLGVPAVSLGAGGEGGGIHTRAEWYDSRGRDLALRRILLLLLALDAAAVHP